MIRRRSTPRRSSRVRDPAYLAAARSLPCLIGHGCDGPVEADHVGARGMGAKSNDDEAVPLCRKHHTERHAMSGYFADHSREDMRAWKQWAIEVTRERVEGRRGAEVIAW